MCLDLDMRWIGSNNEEVTDERFDFFPSHFEMEGIYAIVFAMKGTNV